MVARVFVAMAVGAGLPAGAAVGVPVVADGKAVAAVVTADRPTAVARYAAEELVGHVERATGVKLPVRAEGAAPAGAQPRIYVGDCKAARDAGIGVRKLAPEAFVLRVTDRAVFIAGDDAGGDPLDTDTRAGTLFGVYQWLERNLGARRLWPGERGTVVSKTASVTANPIDVTVAPHFFQRRVRPGLGFTSDRPALGFTPKAAEQHAQEQAVSSAGTGWAGASG